MATQTILDTLSAIEQRRSVKHYDANYAMPQDDVQRLMELTLLSPTSFNIQNWRFVLVTDPEDRKELRKAAWDQAQITEASLVVVLTADMKAAETNPERYWQNAPKEIQDSLVPMIRQFYGNQPQLQRDEVMRSCGIAAQTLMLAAKAMGYDSCPMVGFDPVQVAHVIHLPKQHEIAMIVVVGKAVQPAHARGGQLPLSDVVFYNRF